MSRTITELAKLSAPELQARLNELRTTLVEQKRARAAGELANPHVTKKTRREIAVALTLLSNKSAQITEKKEEA